MNVVIFCGMVDDKRFVGNQLQAMFDVMNFYKKR